MQVVLSRSKSRDIFILFRMSGKKYSECFLFICLQQRRGQNVSEAGSRASNKLALTECELELELEKIIFLNWNSNKTVPVYQKEI